MSDLTDLFGRPPGWLEPAWLGLALRRLIERGWTDEVIHSELGVAAKAIEYVRWSRSAAAVETAKNVDASLRTSRPAGLGEMRDRYASLLEELTAGAQRCGFDVCKTYFVYRSANVSAQVKYVQPERVSPKASSVSLNWQCLLHVQRRRFPFVIGRFSGYPAFINVTLFPIGLRWYEFTPTNSGFDLILDCLSNLSVVVEYLEESSEIREAFVRDQTTLTFNTVETAVASLVASSH